MPCVERLEQVEGFGATDLADQDPVRAMPERRAQQIGDRDGRQRRLLAERRLRASRLESDEVRLLDHDLGRLFDQYDAIVVRDRGGQRVQQRRLSRASATGNQDVAMLLN